MAIKSNVIGHTWVTGDCNEKFTPGLPKMLIKGVTPGLPRMIIKSDVICHRWGPRMALQSDLHVTDHTWVNEDGNKEHRKRSGLGYQLLMKSNVFGYT